MHSLFLKVLDVSLLPLILLVLGWITEKYLVPILKTERRHAVARYVLLLADEVTDWLYAKYPSKRWAEWLDEATDKVMEVTGVKRDTAERAVRAAIMRKKSPR